MSLEDRTTEWQRWLAQAHGFARSGATGEAVARALLAYRAMSDALVGAAPADHAAILEHANHAHLELNRLRELHRKRCERTTARSTAYYEAESRAATTRSRRGVESPTSE